MLIDTNVFIWWSDDPARLSSRAFQAIVDAEQAFLSAVVPWEMTIKFSTGKLALGRSIRSIVLDAIGEGGFQWADISLEAILSVADLPYHHRDPFDRLLIAQAITMGVPIVSADDRFDAYGAERIW